MNRKWLLVIAFASSLVALGLLALPNAMLMRFAADPDGDVAFHPVYTSWFDPGPMAYGMLLQPLALLALTIALVNAGWTVLHQDKRDVQWWPAAAAIGVLGASITMYQVWTWPAIASVLVSGIGLWALLMARHTAPDTA